jgi:hypothetical protein
MRDLPDADLIFIDEARTQVRERTYSDVPGREIGLSATPLSAGLGKLFSGLMNAITMAELTASEVVRCGYYRVPRSR